MFARTGASEGTKYTITVMGGGEVARLLITSYQLIIRDLMQANLHSDESKLDSAEKMLTDLASAWHTAVDPQFGDPPPSH